MYFYYPWAKNTKIIDQQPQQHQDGVREVVVVQVNHTMMVDRAILCIDAWIEKARSFSWNN